MKKIILLVFFAGCNAINVPFISEELNTQSVRSFNNSPSSVGPGEGRILQDNPIILGGGGNITLPISLGTFLTSQRDFLTLNSELKEDCLGLNNVLISPCYQVHRDADSPILGAVEQNKWTFDPNSAEFLQVNVFGHIKRLNGQFLQALELAYQRANPDLTQANGGANYATSLSTQLYERGGFWYGQSLKAYALGENVANAFFRPADFSLSFGVDPQNQGLIFSQDPTVIYHELGHALIHIMLNQRNIVAQTELPAGVKAQLGSLFYDEAGALGEGLADYFSFVANGRKHLGEWALGNFYQSDRPMSESSPLHNGQLGRGPSGKIAYPHYVDYDPHFPDLPNESIHYSGMTISHFFVALTEKFQGQCQMDHQEATRHVIALLSETLGELGDLTSRGSDHRSGSHINHQTSNENGDFVSKIWHQTVRPVNFRHFFQTLGKFFLQIYPGTNQCRGGNFSKDQFEQLLDSYGLLIFSTYNDNLNGEASGQDDNITLINPANRQHSLSPVNKDKLIYKRDVESDAPLGFLFDNRQQLLAIAESFSGVLSEQIPSGLVYNNGNGRVSPGELVGIALNVMNNSDQPMAGVQILATPWDHTKREDQGQERLCFIQNTPDNSEASADSNPPIVGDCGHITRSHGGEEREDLGAVCFATTPSLDGWVSQEELMNQVGLTQNECLDPANKKECFFRAVPGGNQAYYSKINAGQTWDETFAPGDLTPVYTSSNLLLFEVHPDTPLNARFYCRFRARFTNCKDCFEDPNAQVSGEEYFDYEYSGEKPFKLLDIEIDIGN